MIHEPQKDLRKKTNRLAEEKKNTKGKRTRDNPPPSASDGTSDESEDSEAERKRKTRKEKLPMLSEYVPCNKQGGKDYVGENRFLAYRKPLNDCYEHNVTSYKLQTDAEFCKDLKTKTTKYTMICTDLTLSICTL